MYIYTMHVHSEILFNVLSQQTPRPTSHINSALECNDSKHRQIEIRDIPVIYLYHATETLAYDNHILLYHFYAMYNSMHG